MTVVKISRVIDGKSTIVEEELQLPDPDSLGRALRRARDRELRKTDWTQLADAPITANKRVEWANYRQQLRDLPSQADFPTQAPFPARPTAD